MSKATNKAKQQAKAKKKPRKYPARQRGKRRNPPSGKGPFDLGINNSAIGLGLVIAGIALIFPDATLRAVNSLSPKGTKCVHQTLIECPRDSAGAFTDKRCKHYGHVPGMCHECYCLGKGCAECVGQFGQPCPPDCINFGKRFDGCHRRDCLGECGTQGKPN